jgi:hypothetical protein
MRTFLYDHLTSSEDLQEHLGGVEGIQDRVMPRQSQENILAERPFLVYGLGNSSNEDLGDPTANDYEAERQFFQVWIHDEPGDYQLIDDLAEMVKRRLVGMNVPQYHITTIAFLETSAEFSNQTYNTIFRYIRFQAIKSQGVIPL